MKDSFAFALQVDNLDQATTLRVALAGCLTATWPHRSDAVLRASLHGIIPLLRRARCAGNKNMAKAILLERRLASE